MSTLWEARTECLRDAGVTRCPHWCAQPEDEHLSEDHVSVPVSLTNVDGQEILVRVAASWTAPDQNHLFVRTALDEDGDLALTAGDLFALATLGERLLALAEEFWNDADSGTIWAYPGAEHDEEDEEE